MAPKLSEEQIVAAYEHADIDDSGLLDINEVRAGTARCRGGNHTLQPYAIEAATRCHRGRHPVSRVQVGAALAYAWEEMYVRDAMRLVHLSTRVKDASKVNAAAPG